MSLLDHKFKFNLFKRKKIAGSKPGDALSDQEKQILEMISLGKSYQTIANELGITKEQVQKTIRFVYGKLQQKKNKL